MNHQPINTGLRERIREHVATATAQGVTPGSAQIAAELCAPHDKVRHALSVILRQGGMENVGTEYKALYRSLAKPAPSVALPNTRSIHERGTYQGEDLLPAPGIPAGRFAAFRLPSRHGDRLHHPGGKVTRLCGAAV